ncbi:hypothetical protein B0H17DRAFT_860571, partial [Mycena rosella]
KWNDINQVVCKKIIGILLVQEAHLNEERCEKVEHLFHKTLQIYRSENLQNPTGKGSVAIVLNRQLTNVNGVKITEIITGCAIHIQTNWHREEEINVLGVYAPNDSAENTEFWKEIEDYFVQHPNTPKPDLMGGDFNMV